MIAYHIDSLVDFIKSKEKKPSLMSNSANHIAVKESHFVGEKNQDKFIHIFLIDIQSSARKSLDMY